MVKNGIFASAYGYQSGDSNGWVGFGNTGSDRGSGTLTDPYRPYREGYIFAGWKCSGYGAINKRSFSREESIQRPGVIMGQIMKI